MDELGSQSTSDMLILTQSTNVGYSVVCSLSGVNVILLRPIVENTQNLWALLILSPSDSRDVTFIAVHNLYIN